MRYTFVLFLAIACGHRDAPPSQSAAPPAGATGKRVDPSKELSPLIGRLQYEARHRPPAEVPAEHVLDELARAQLEVVERRQYVGAAVKAAYCLGGTTRSGVALSVCEYPNAEAAAAGKQFMDTRFAAMQPAAARAVNRTTVLSVADMRGHEAGDVSRALEVFAAVTPR